ncbi:MAG: DMT family transporter, partial [Desulfurococcaceae archaeon]
PSLYTGITLTREAVIYIVYLALVCSILATFFQVLGQRYVSASTAALIFLLEPVFATQFSVLMGLETVEPYKMVGGGLILLSLYIATVSEIRQERGR